MIILDSVRADHLDCYGYAKPTAPNLAALAGRGTRFERCYAQSNVTPASVATLFTGTPPRVHGVQHVATQVRRSVPTLAETFAQDGVPSCMISSWPIFGSGYPATRGFTECIVCDEAWGGDTTEGEAITETALKWLQANRGERFFLCLHYPDAHFPYAAPCKAPVPPVNEPRNWLLRPLWQEQSRGAQAVRRALLAAQWEWNHPVLARSARAIQTYTMALLEPIARAMIAVNRCGLPVGDHTKAYIAYRYEQCIYYLDSLIGHIIDYLDSSGLAHDTLVVVTADHGEELFERGHLGHGRTLYEEVVHVPLIAYFPGAPDPPRVWPEIVRHLDVMPTIADAIGSELNGVETGCSLLRGFTEGPFQPGPAFSEGRTRRGSAACMVDGRLKVIRNEITEALQLYDLEADPTERRDLASHQPAVAEHLADTLSQVLEQTGASATEPVETFAIPPAVEKRLRGLGYW